MGLSKAEYKRRLDAALALRGMKRKELPDLLVERGMHKNDASRAGHAGDDYMPNEALAMVLGKILGVGQAWFEEPDLGRLIAGADLNRMAEPRKQAGGGEDVAPEDEFDVEDDLPDDEEAPDEENA